MGYKCQAFRNEAKIFLPTASALLLARRFPSQCATRPVVRSFHRSWPRRPSVLRLSKILGILCGCWEEGVFGQALCKPLHCAGSGHSCVLRIGVGSVPLSARASGHSHPAGPNRPRTADPPSLLTFGQESRPSPWVESGPNEDGNLPFGTDSDQRRVTVALQTKLALNATVRSGRGLVTEQSLGASAALCHLVDFRVALIRRSAKVSLLPDPCWESKRSVEFGACRTDDGGCWHICAKRYGSDARLNQ